MIRSYVLDPAAVADMQGVARYTYRHWGAVQTRLYTAKLHRCMDTLAKGECAYRDMGTIHPGLRYVLCEHHYVFMLPRRNKPAVVLAILHERMDFLERLRVRLGGR